MSGTNNPISFRLSDDVAALLDREAAKRDMSRNVLARELVQAALNEKKDDAVLSELRRLATGLQAPDLSPVLSEVRELRKLLLAPKPAEQTTSSPELMELLGGLKKTMIRVRKAVEELHADEPAFPDARPDVGALGEKLEQFGTRLVAELKRIYDGMEVVHTAAVRPTAVLEGLSGVQEGLGVVQQALRELIERTAAKEGSDAQGATQQKLEMLRHDLATSVMALLVHAGKSTDVEAKRWVKSNILVPR